MIFDRLDNLRHYGELPRGIAAAVDLLTRTDFHLVADGRHEIDGDRLVAIVQRYRTRPPAEAVWEAHRRHIDVQYMLEGTERMGHLLLRDDLPIKQPYDADRDAIFFDVQGSLGGEEGDRSIFSEGVNRPKNGTVPARPANGCIEAGPGDAAVFFPHDIHAPCLSVGDSAAEVRKVVVKCLLG